jgi:DNA-binding response OmpR family regulator
MSSLNVLVVEDAVEYTQAVSAVLKQGGHDTRVAGSMNDALAELAAATPDLVILDLSLPDGDGLDLCRRIRERTDAYILMLTGRDAEIDKLIGFSMGADDYVTKPFSPRELGARIEALARRPRVADLEPEARQAKNLTLRVATRELLVGDQLVELTRTEFDLLEIITASPKLVFTRPQLLERLWGKNWFGDDHVIDVHIANLRKKLKAAGGDDVIRTVRGVGYGCVKL